MDIVVSALHVYPVKSCKGTELAEAYITKRGIEHDRSFLIVNEGGVAITQRDCPQLALVKPNIIDGKSWRFEFPSKEPLTIIKTLHGAGTESQVWNDKCESVEQGADAAAWFSEITGVKSRLLCMRDEFVRGIDARYATAQGQQVGFADGFPFLLISESSLDDLNSKLEAPVPMNRFRPNIVVSGCHAFAEDSWSQIEIGNLLFDVVKPCARCVMTTIDQDDAEMGKEPLRTLSLYRKTDNKVMFGQNLVHHSTGKIKVGDRVRILKSK